jgi:sulfite exporter TauE/SafE
METGYIVAFITGFLGGFGHCIGMCGPIVASCTFHDNSSSQTGGLLPHILYNTGRITTYMFVGALMGLTGSFVNVAGGMSGLQNIVALIAGLFMIVMGLNITGFIGTSSWFESHSSPMLKAGKELLYEKSVWRYLPLGALFGFLPCGLSYTAFIAAAGTGSLLSGMLLLLFFGLGTAPALLLFGVAASYITTKVRGVLYKSAGVIVVVMGGLFLYRGLKIMF